MCSTRPRTPAATSVPRLPAASPPTPTASSRSRPMAPAFVFRSAPPWLPLAHSVIRSTPSAVRPVPLASSAPRRRSMTSRAVLSSATRRVTPAMVAQARLVVRPSPTRTAALARSASAPRAPPARPSASACKRKHGGASPTTVPLGPSGVGQSDTETPRRSVRCERFELDSAPRSHRPELHLNQALPQPFGHRLDSVRHVELSINVLEVRSNRRLRQVEHARRFTVRHALGDQLQNL